MEAAPKHCVGIRGVCACVCLSVRPSQIGVNVGSTFVKHISRAGYLKSSVRNISAQLNEDVF